MPMPGLAPLGAVGDLGLGDMLGQQVSDLSEEERKKRMLQQQQQHLIGPSGSLAVPALFGPSGGRGSAAGY